MVKSTMTGTVTSSGHGGGDGAERRDGGRAFHTRAAANGKARSPSMACLWMVQAALTLKHFEDALQLCLCSVMVSTEDICTQQAV